jgi:hypothetical protein
LDIRAANPRFGLDQAGGLHALQQGSQRLVRIESFFRKMALRTPRILFDLSKRVPLNKTYAQRRKALVQLSMVAVLNAFD